MHGENLRNIRVREKRALRVRKKLRGTSECPRLCVVKTCANIDVQIINDEAGITLAHVNTYSKEFKQKKYGKKNKETARKLGEKIAELAKQKNIHRVIFDRGPFKYHGVLAALADAAREKGLVF